MTRVQFYHNTPDKLALVCELAASAHAGGRRVAVRMPDAVSARQLDQQLWSFEQLSFIPHVMADSPLAAATPVVIGLAGRKGDWPHSDLLFNLAPDVPADFDKFRLLVEIVGQSEADKEPGRMRYRHYKARELSIQLFDTVKRTAL